VNMLDTALLSLLFLDVTGVDWRRCIFRRDN
jgi:hypothetical protein